VVETIGVLTLKGRREPVLAHLLRKLAAEEAGTARG
jgi:hypothetical protein